MRPGVNNGQPVAYIRKSRVTTDRTVSWEVQEAAVKSMAPVPEELLILSDWNRSGRGTAKRPGYRQLLAMIEADRVSALYSYSLSRLSRSLADFSRLVELCLAHSVPIHLYSERHLDFTTATGRLMVSILAAFAQMEGELGQERARDAVAVRRLRGDRIGPEPFSRPELVLAAYREAGSILGAARVLTIQGVPTRRGGPWHPSTVRQLMDREYPGVLPRNKAPGAKGSAPFIFYRLLQCHCGRTLTGVRYTNGSTKLYTTYRCLVGRYTPGHGKQSVPESAVLGWARDEMLHLQLPAKKFTAGGNETQRAGLYEKRRRILDNYEDGLLSRGERDEKLLVISNELELLDERVYEFAQIDWEAPSRDLNEALRAVWEVVEMGSDQRPRRAVWRFPEWRRD